MILFFTSHMIRGKYSCFWRQFSSLPCAMWWPLGKISKKPLLLNIVRRSGVTGSQNLEVEEGGSSDIWSPLCSFLHVIELLYALGGCQERQLSLVPIYIGLVINCQKFIFNFLEKKTCNNVFFYANILIIYIYFNCKQVIKGFLSYWEFLRLGD